MLVELMQLQKTIAARVLLGTSVRQGKRRHANLATSQKTTAQMHWVVTLGALCVAILKVDRKAIVT